MVKSPVKGISGICLGHLTLNTVCFCGNTGTSFNNSLVPIPDLYKGSTRVGGPGAFLPGGLGAQRRTGTKKGYASAPPIVHGLEDDEDEDFVFSLEDIALKSDIHDGYAEFTGNFTLEYDS